MKRNFYEILEHLKIKKYTWLVTGAAGFIGSNLVDALLNLNQEVIGLDNLSLGSIKNLNKIIDNHDESFFKFFEGDVSNLEDCVEACTGVDFVLHQAALGSIPRSISSPLNTNNSNVNGFLNILETAKNKKVKSFVYAGSSSTYGDHKDLPKTEEKIGKPLNPYSITKYVNELYADIYSMHYGFESTGLRYFNVFGRRQRENGDYAAVIPKWINNIINNKKIEIYGDGITSRDFCYIDNVIQANILATFNKTKKGKCEVYNIAVGHQTSLNSLFDLIKSSVEEKDPSIMVEKPIYKDFRAGDMRHSQANISKAKKLLGYTPNYKVKEGIKETVSWYMEEMQK
tara:strand:- start:378 stop:1403 length:1026 start_codon:yes stop_codon:yes gene_type:complete